MIQHRNRMTPEEKARFREFFRILDDIAEKGTKERRKVIEEANQGIKKKQ